MRGDCPLRAALRLADLDGKPYPVTFDKSVFSEPVELVLREPIPAPMSEVTIDASDVAPLTVRVESGTPALTNGESANLETVGIEFR
jgi:hypothetical protein